MWCFSAVWSSTFVVWPFQRHDGQQDGADLHKDWEDVGSGVPEMLGKVSFAKSWIRKCESDEIIVSQLLFPGYFMLKKYG